MGNAILFFLAGAIFGAPFALLAAAMLFVSRVPRDETPVEIERVWRERANLN